MEMIRLEYFNKSDFKQLIEWINNEPLLISWAGSLFRYPLDEDKLEWYIEDTNNIHESDALVYKAIDTKNENVVGHISIGSISRSNKSARITRVLVSSTCQGKGICQGMIKAAIKIGFEDLDLHKISLGVYEFNTAAIRCYEKAGFVTEGILRDTLKYDDNYWSLVEMSILEDEWRKKYLKEEVPHS
jgi:RimJ/RimL family protein N-acetyltransferase